MADQNEVAKAKITIEADIESAKSGIQSVKADMESVGPTADSASAQTQEAISRVIGRLDEIIAILDGVEKKTKDVTEFSKKAWSSAADSMNPYIAGFEKIDKVTAKSAEETASAGAKINSVFGRLGDTLEGGTSGVRKFVGALSSVAGVATGLIGVIGLVAGALTGMKAILDKLAGGDEGNRNASLPRAADLLGELADKARGVDQALSQSPGFVAIANEIQDLESSLEKLRNSLDGLNAAGSAGIGAGAGTFRERQATLKRISGIEAELAAKRQQQADLLLEITRRENERAEAAERESQALQKQAATLDAILQIAEGVAIDLLPEDEQVEQNARRQIKQIIKIAEAAGVDLEHFYVRAAITAIEEKRDRELELLDDLHKKEMQNIAAQEAEKDRRSQERAQREVETIRQGLESITAGEFTTVLASIPRVLQEVSTRLGRLK